MGSYLTKNKKRKWQNEMWRNKWHENKYSYEEKYQWRREGVSGVKEAQSMAGNLYRKLSWKKDEKKKSMAKMAKWKWNVEMKMNENES